MIAVFHNRFDYYGFLKHQGVEDPDDCMKWALGGCFKTMLVSETYKRWNERHGEELFMINRSDLFIPGMEKIAKAYLALPEIKV